MVRQHGTGDSHSADVQCDGCGHAQAKRYGDLSANNSRVPLLKDHDNLALAAAQWARPIRQTLAATGGTGAYTWQLTIGALPAGLSCTPLRE